jgi:hypothetical protein
MAEMLSENFSVAEFEHSDTAIAKNIPNKMNALEKAMAKHTAQYLLENIRKQLNIKYASKTVKCVAINITSGFRSLALNAAVGGVNKAGNISQHCKGMACDIEATIVYKNGKRKNLTYIELYNNIKELTKQKKLYIDQCIQEAAYNSKTKTWSYWVHVSLCGQISQCRYQFLKYNNKEYTLDCVLK